MGLKSNLLQSKSLVLNETKATATQRQSARAQFRFSMGSDPPISMPSTRSSQRCRSAHGTERRFSSAATASDSSPRNRLGPTNFEAIASGRSFVVSMRLAKSRMLSKDRSIAKMSPDTAVGVGENRRSVAVREKTAARSVLSVCPPQVSNVLPLSCHRVGSYPLWRARAQIMLRLVGSAAPVALIFASGCEAFAASPRYAVPSPPDISFRMEQE